MSSARTLRRSVGGRPVRPRPPVRSHFNVTWNVAPVHLQCAHPLPAPSPRQCADVVREVAGGEVATASLVFEWRLDLMTDILGNGAARMEATALWDVDRA